MDWEAFYNSFRQPGFVPGYEIENRLGGGAFGDVYKARKTSIGKAYAVKFLKVENEDQRDAVQRELDQVRHFASIDHPNLVSIEDMGMVMDVPYLIMGYAGEETLAKRFKAADLAPAEALQLFTQIARGVLALHDRRLVHFDLKPSNVFIRGENARVGDYGLSKLLEGGHMTLSFGRGTPMYMAPEMLRGRADHRADIYSLGVILFESLAGRIPFAPDEFGGLVLRETDDPPVFPANFPTVARPAVEMALRLDPKHRPESVSELLELLGQTARPGDSVVFDLPPEESRPVRPAVLRGHEPESTPTGLSAAQAFAEPERARPPAVEPLADAPAISPLFGTGSPRTTGESSTPPPSGLRTPSLLDGGFEARDDASIVESPAGGAGDGPSAIEDGSTEGAPIPAGTPASRARMLVRELSQRSKGESRTFEAPPAPSVVPVPPKVQGGLTGTLAETTRVGFDVFVGAIVAVVGGVFGAYKALLDRLVRSRQGGFVARTVRFGVFLFLMAGLGFGATVLGLVGLLVMERVGGVS